MGTGGLGVGFHLLMSMIRWNPIYSYLLKLIMTCLVDLHAVNREAAGKPLSAVLRVARDKPSKKAAQLGGGDANKADIRAGDHGL